MRMALAQTLGILTGLTILQPECESEPIKTGSYKGAAHILPQSQESARWIGVYVTTNDSELVKKITISRKSDGLLNMRASLGGLPGEVAEYDAIAKPYSPLGKNKKGSLLARFNSGKFQPVMVVVDRSDKVIAGETPSNKAKSDEHQISRLTYTYSMRDIDGSAMQVTGAMKRDTSTINPVH